MVVIKNCCDEILDSDGFFRLVFIEEQSHSRLKCD